MLKNCTSSGLSSIAHEANLGSSNQKPPAAAAGSGAPSTSGASPSAAPAATTTTAGPMAGSGGWTRERVMRKFPLLYPTLEGLARYTHLIDVEYFNDLMEVFKEVRGH